MAVHGDVRFACDFKAAPKMERCNEDVDMMSLTCPQVNPIKQNHAAETAKS